MKIDVVICTYNRSALLVKCLESLLRAGVPQGVSVEIMVVDNNSSDDTAAVARGLQAAGGPKVRYLLEKTQGKSHALNRALSEVTGDVVAFTDDDITADPSYFKEIANAVRRYPGCGSFGGRIVAVYPEVMPSWLDLHGSMKFLKSVYVDLDNGDRDAEYGRGVMSNPGGANMFFTREALERNGPFRTDLGPTGRELGFSEDTEFCRRFRDRGECSMYISGVVVYHPVHKERLEKEYLLKWLYRCGKSEVRRTGGYKAASAFGVPRYIFGKLARHASGSVFSFSERTRLYHRFRLYYTAGELVEHLRVNSGQGQHRT